MRPIDDLREKIDLWRKSTTDTALMSVLHDVLKQIDMAIYEMDHQEDESPWHRVEEPPEENGRYLVSWEGAVTTDEYKNGVWLYASMFNQRVTHWTMIPEPPKEDA